MSNPEKIHNKHLLAEVAALKQKIRELELSGEQKLLQENTNKTQSITDNEIRFHYLVKNSSDLITIIDANGKEKFVSDSVERITGFTPEEVINRSGFEFIHPDDVEQMRKTLKELLETPGKTIRKTYRHRHKNGNWLYLEAIGTNYLHEPLIEGIVLNIRNITEHKLSEERTTHLNAVIRAIRNINQLIIQIKDRDTLIKKICEDFVDTRGFESAWIALFDKNMQMTHFEGAGMGPDYEKMKEIFSQPRIPECVNHKIVKQDKVLLVKNVLEDCKECPVARIYKGKTRSMMIKRLNYADEFYGIINVSLSINYIDDVEEQELFSEVAGDIAYALYNLKIEEQHRKAEIALQESEINLRALFKAMTDAVFEINYEGRYVNIAPTSVPFVYKPYNEFLGKTLHDIFPEEKADYFLKYIRTCLNENKTVSMEYTLPIQEREVWFEGRATPKTKNSVLFIARDITERKQAEKAILESEKKYKILFMAANDAIFLMKNYTFISCNPKTLEIFGCTEEEIIGHTPIEFSPEYQPDGTLSAESAKKRINEALSGETQFFEWVHQKKDGTLFYAEISLSKILFSDEEYVHAMVRDVTERKTNEQVQKVLYDISNAVITTKNLEEFISLIQVKLGSILDTTNFYIALYDEKSDMLSFPFYADEKDKFTSVPAGKTLTKYVIESNKPLLADRAVMEELIRKGKFVYHGSLSKIWLGVPLKTDGKVMGVLAVQSYTDEHAFTESDKKMLEFVSDQISISIDRKKAEEDLREALNKAEESDRLKSAFLANMSHEIRTPMNGIMSFINLLSKPKLTGEEQQAYIDIIKKSSDRMLNTVNDLIDISLIESNQVKVINEKVNVNEQLENLYAFFKPEADGKGIDLGIVTTLPSGESVIVTDPGKFYSIMTNLINNAIKFTIKGSVVFGYKKNDGILEFYVRDTGIGISKDKQQIIFDRFVQADTSLTRQHEGVGLGLSITKAYVKMLGGKLWLVSEPGKGTTFRFTLPYNKPLKEKPADTGKKPGVAENNLPHNLKIMIVEDDEIADAYLTIILKNIGREILHAATGADAINLFMKNPDIDLILMDVKMPEMDGYESTRIIRSINKDVVIIAQTAYALASDREKALQAGSDDYISKPFNKEKLLDIIARHTMKRRSGN